MSSSSCQFMPTWIRVCALCWLILFIACPVSLATAQSDGQEQSAETQPADQEKSGATQTRDKDVQGADDKAAEAGSEMEDDDENGQADLDQAFQLKITASSTRDLDKVADLCESAIEKGLPDESRKQATELWASVLIDHAKQLNRRIAPRGKLSTRWRWLRSQAISRLENAIELQPRKIDALILLAKLHSLNAGDKEAAMEAIEKAIAQLTDDKKKLSEALFIRARLAEEEATRLADLTQAVKIDPQNYEALMERAVYYLGKEKTDEAMDDFRAVLEIEADNTDRYILISQALRGRRLADESIEILDLAIEANPENAELFFLRGQGHLAVENNDKALEDLNAALDIDRQNTDALNLRARVYMVKEEYENAIKDANEIIQLKPDEPTGLALRSLIYRSQPNLDKAIEDVEALLEMKPGDLDFRFDLAILYNANEQPSKAVPIFDEIIRRLPEPAQGQILRNRGDAYLSMGEHQRAIEDYETAIDIIEENSGSDLDGMSDARELDIKAGLLNNLSWVLSTSPKDDIRDGQRAIELATEAAELTEFKQAYILSTLAAGYAETDDFESARKWAAKAVELAESDEQRKGLQEELDSYEEDKPWRELEDVEGDKQNSEDGKDEPKSADGDSEDDGKEPEQDGKSTDAEGDGSSADDEKDDD